MFPYLIITDSNKTQFEGTAPQARPTGYLGWQHPDAPRVFCGPKPVTDLIPRSAWTERITAGWQYGTFLRTWSSSGASRRKTKGSWAIAGSTVRRERPNSGGSSAARPG